MVLLKLLYMLFKIVFEQCAFDIFLIDWERPKVHQHTFRRQEGGQNAAVAPLAAAESKVDVNAWRSLFLLNEFNEMQTYRLINSELTLILYGLFMEGFGLKYLDSYDPYFNPLNSDSTNAPRHFALFFLVTTIVIYGIGVAQYALRYAVTQCKPLRTVEFVDMCAVSNISILMFDESFQGYYIHGQSPFGYAEISAERLRKSLEFEASGKAQIRGLSQEDPELQTFEIFIPPDLTRQYKKQLQSKQIQAIDSQIQANQTLTANVSKTFTINAAVPKNLKIEELDTERKIMNKLMMQYVEKVRLEPKKFIKLRSGYDRFCNRAPPELAQNQPVMYKDPACSYGKFFLMGMDFDFLMLEVFVISLVHTVFRDRTGMDVRLLMGVLIAYLVDSGLTWIRKTWGRRNFAKNTLIDE